MTRGNRDKCYYCGQPEACTKDHFIPVSRRGFLTVWACRVCQASKGNLMPLDWVDYLKKHVMINQESVTRVETAVNSLWNKILRNEIKAYHVR